MSDERQKVYRAHVHYDCGMKKGIGVFCHYGYLSPCGEWVDGGSVQWRRTPEWRETEEEARAVLAPEIAEIGARLIRQAGELLAAAEAAKVAVEVAA